MYFYIADKHMYALITEKEGLWIKENKKQNTEQWSGAMNNKRTVMMQLEKASDSVDSGILSRITNMEKYMNNIYQINKDNRMQLNKLDKKIDALENKLNILVKRDESVVNTNHEPHRRDMNPNALEQNIRDVKRAASLLAISNIKLEDLPYTIHCDSNIEGGAESHMDGCIQTRLEELYNDYNDVLDFHVMLVDGPTPNKGRLEIIYRGQHGTICDHYWGYNDARVACKMLGYEKGGYAYTGSHFGNGTGEILLDKIECTGEESSLLGCTHRGIKGYDDVGSYCHHGRDAGVKCYT